MTSVLLKVNLNKKVNRAPQRGFTLFEVLAALAIVGLILGLVVTTAGRSVDRNIKKTSTRLSSTIKYLYNKSVLENLYIRLVLDMDERSYWVEATSDPLVVDVENEESRKKKANEVKEQSKTENARSETEATPKEPEGGLAGRAAARAKGTLQEEGLFAENEVKKIEPPKPVFGKVDSFLLRPTKLPDGVFFKDIQVEHRDSPTDAGAEPIYFFPSGRVERAIINLRDEDDKINYSLEVNPANGRVNIEDRYRSLYGAQ